MYAKLFLFSNLSQLVGAFAAFVGFLGVGLEVGGEDGTEEYFVLEGSVLEALEH